MPSEPNLRLNESLFSGRPYGYGFVPVSRSLRFPAQPPTADSRPQQLQQQTAGAGDLVVRKRKKRKGRLREFFELWDDIVDIYERLPGFWESLGGILATPLRLLRKLFTKRGLITAAIAVVAIFVLFVASIPFMTTGHTDARRSEGEQLLGSTKGQLRVAWAKTNDMDEVRKELRLLVARGELTGKYFVVEPYILPMGSNRARIYVRPLHPKETPGYLEFSWAGGDGQFHWQSERRDE